MAKPLHADRYQEMLGLLRASRLEAGFTQTELAARLGVPQSYVSKVERGERRIDVIELREMADVLGVPLERLVPR